MLRVVCDTNVYISALHFDGELKKLILYALEGRFKLFISEEILTELASVLKRKFNYTDRQINEIEDLLISVEQVVRPTKTDKKTKGGPTDNRILECTFETKADYLVSGDKRHLLPLKKFKSIEVVTPRQFLEILEEAS